MEQEAKEKIVKDSFEKSKRENQPDRHGNGKETHGISLSTGLGKLNASIVETHERRFLNSQGIQLMSNGDASKSSKETDSISGVNLDKVTTLKGSVKSIDYPKALDEPIQANPPNRNDSNMSTLGYYDSKPSAVAKANRKRAVPHVYRDFSNMPDSTGYVRKKTGGVTQPFPEKLHEMLERENEPLIVSWLPHGRAFLVRKPKEFTNHVMPK